MFELIIFLVLISAGYIIGRSREALHLKSIRRRERASRHMPISTLKTVQPNVTVSKVQLVSGVCVISTDYFKFVAASLKSLIGGRLTTYESLLDRARREAVLRMKAQALQAGCNSVMNVRFETSSISGMKAGGKQRAVQSLEVIASGTAIKTL